MFMKKALLTIAFLGIALPAIAKDNNTGFVFVPENMIIETVADVKNKSDETIVVMQGQIAKALGDEKYMFTDKTGEIIIEIDDEDFNGVTVTAGEMVEISGEVDKEMMKPAKVEVKSIKKMKK
ncbi:MAG: NirD/YgiW/YdeI family stress tolerance protein [Alphaproteobacteria bacterium]|nr:NirD/YgiW/YdeI family stress tolerance protein [Alphaproteobacteria bacterium]